MDPISVVTARFKVLPEWVDVNGHMNMAFYSLVFDHSVDALLEVIGLGHDHVASAGAGTFVVETHNVYRSELREGDPILSAVHLLGFDDKRLHLAIEMRHADTSALCAVSEQVCMNVDLTSRRSAAMPATVLNRLQRFGLADAEKLGLEVGRSIHLRRA